MAMAEINQLEPLVDMTDLLDQPEEMRRRGAEDGYLYFAGLLSPSKVNDLRSQILSVCDRHGWVKEGSDLAEGLANKDILVVESNDPRWIAFYNDLQKVRDFHNLALDENLIHVLEILFGEPVLPHSRNICRLVFPDSVEHTTPPHQDNFYIGGSENTWTAWIPCGDCPATLGGLAVAKGSHQQGLLEYQDAVGPGNH